MMGLALLGGALVCIGPTSGGGAAGALGMMAALSGLVGWCPMCALAVLQATGSEDAPARKDRRPERSS
jgi:hypothetical protein